VPLSPAISLALPGSGLRGNRYDCDMNAGRAKDFVLAVVSFAVAVQAQTTRLDQFVGKDLREDRANSGSWRTFLGNPSRRANAVYRRYGSAGVHRSGQFNGVRAVVWHSTKMIASWCFESARRLKQAAVRIVTRTPRILNAAFTEDPIAAPHTPNLGHELFVARVSLLPLEARRFSRWPNS